MQIGLLGLLAIVFIVLKLCGVITWSWLWVLCPLWGGIALAVVVFLVLALLVTIFGVGVRAALRSKW